MPGNHVHQIHNPNRLVRLQMLKNERRPKITWGLGAEIGRRAFDGLFGRRCRRGGWQRFGHPLTCGVTALWLQNNHGFRGRSRPRHTYTHCCAKCWHHAGGGLPNYLDPPARALWLALTYSCTLRWRHDSGRATRGISTRKKRRACRRICKSPGSGRNQRLF